MENSWDDSNNYSGNWVNNIYEGYGKYEWFDENMKEISWNYFKLNDLMWNSILEIFIKGKKKV